MWNLVRSSSLIRINPGALYWWKRKEREKRKPYKSDHQRQSYDEVESKIIAKELYHRRIPVGVWGQRGPWGEAEQCFISLEGIVDLTPCCSASKKSACQIQGPEFITKLERSLWKRKWQPLWWRLEILWMESLVAMVLELQKFVQLQPNSVILPTISESQLWTSSCEIMSQFSQRKYGNWLGLLIRISPFI